ncbi:MAG: TolC family protein [Taibaiella sp.]|nr:TolC family protein [Taibaiella sp.]
MKRNMQVERVRNRMVILLLLLTCTVCPVFANDTARVLGKNDVLNIVRTYHPVVLQAGIRVSRAEADIQAARGGFDPTVGAGLDRKTFDGKLYYNYFNPEVNIPTWYGIELKGGIEEVRGERVTTETTLGKTSYAGVKVPVNSLFFDKRRAALRQAQALKQQTEAERRQAVNDVIYEALSAYWNWVREYMVYRVIKEAVTVNEERFRFVRTEYEQGARPAIDTTEALAQLQAFYVQESEAWMSFQNAGNDLANFLWLENAEPVSWSASVIPDTIDAVRVIGDNEYPALAELIAAVPSHPKLAGMESKINVLEIERKLKAQSLTPKLSLSGNVLNKGYALPPSMTTPFLENNHKVGIDFSMPLFLREARGAYRAAGFKLQETHLEQSNVALQIENKVRSYYNEFIALNRQVSLFEGAYNSYVRLFQGERLKFSVGESSLFLLNTRENKLLESARKLAELRTKRHKALAGLMWSAGSLQ